jgi:hypothetical protein
MSKHTKAGMDRENTGKWEGIASALVDRIVAGEWCPDERIPTHRELEAQYNASRVTIQRAVDRLIDFDFLATYGRRGTFVPHRPPHLYRFAIIYGCENPPRNLFKRIFLECCQHELATRDLVANTYFGITSDAPRQALAPIEQALQMRAFAGVVLDQPSLSIVNMVQRADLPAVSLMGKPRAGCPSVSVNSDRFLEMAMARATELRCSRPALLTSPCHSEVQSSVPGIPAEWIQSVAVDHPQWANNVTRLLFDRQRERRPDALIITDDNLSLPACLALLELGHGIGDDVQVITHCNFPQPQLPFPRAHRLGFDINAMVGAALDTLATLRGGGTPPLQRRIDPCWEAA